MVANVAATTVYRDMHNPLFAVNHLVAKSYEVSVLMGVGIRKDGLSEQPRGIRMDEVTPVASQQDEVGVGIGMFRGYNILCHSAERQVGGDDTQDRSLLGKERMTVGGNGFVMIDGSFRMFVERLYLSES